MKRGSLVILILVLALSLSGPVAAVEFSADMITSISGREDTGKIYFKNQKLFRNETMGMIIINKHPKVYQLFQDSKKYVVTDVNELKKQNPMAGVENFDELVKKNNMQKQGTETIQGFKCVIYSGKVKFIENQPGMTMKFWYSKKLDYPIKNVSTLPAPMGEVSSYLQNIKTGKQPDSLFKIPAGYQKAASMQEAMGMGNMQMPSMQDAGKPPSKEEMEKMMEQMKKMMKQKPAQ